jgi:hypothetical protein
VRSPGHRRGRPAHPRRGHAGDDSGPDYAELKTAQEGLEERNNVQEKQVQWALNVLSCIDSPSTPMWYGVDWPCLFGKVTTYFPRKPRFYRPEAEGCSSSIPERAQVRLYVFGNRRFKGGSLEAEVVLSTSLKR